MGLRAEARIARPLAALLRAPIAVGGGTAEGAASAARALVAEGARALVSFGLAGGLNPSLRAGALLVPERVILGEMVLATDTRLTASLGGSTKHTILAGSRLAATEDEKAALHHASGADAIDLETASVIAACAGRPFAVVRAVCDPANRSLPPAAMLALNDAGQMRIWRVLRSVAVRPGQITGLLLLARDAARAHAALSRHIARVSASAPVVGQFGPVN